MNTRTVSRWLGRLVSLLPMLLLTARAADSVPAPRERLLMDRGWRFHLGDEWGLAEKLDKAGVSLGPAGKSFGDAGWRKLDLPHDWAIELPFDSHADTSHGFKALGPGYHSNDIGWYRRTFALPATDLGKRLWIQFDGVYRNCRVFFNGYLIGHHESGYSSFIYDITDLANYGGDNTLAVRVDASEFEGWFYEGAGIYRHVWLLKSGPLFVAPDGVFVYSKFPNNIPGGPATIHMEAAVKNGQTNQARARLEWQILDPSGKIVARARASAQIQPWTGKTISAETKVRAPALWSPESPRLYKLITTVTADGKIADRTETEFGIRTVAFDASQGFLLNGKPYTIKGTCNHQDHAGVGAALPDALQYFRVQQLKEMGGNAVRTSHNAPTPEWLEACDRLGLLVMDENRLLGSDAANLFRLDSQIRHDRNHPSVFIWSLFNEETRQTTPEAGRSTETMQRLVHLLDPTRLCTAAANEGDVYEGVTSVLDVRGWNYYIHDVDSYHAKHPLQPEIGTEQASTLSTRGIYENDKRRGYMSAYDTNAPRWGNTAEDWWQVYSARPWLSGAFVWTGFDYRGEPTPYAWPCINSHFGILDTCGFPKDNFYYYQAWWGSRPVVHLLPHWNWPGLEDKDIDVWCYANTDEVELFLNGQSLGRKPMPKNSHLQWAVKYEPGTLEAVGYSGGKMVAQDRVETTGQPAGIRLLTPDLKGDPTAVELRADGRQNISIVAVAVVDADGRIVPTANNSISFDLSGPGKILGVGNGDPSCHEPDTFIGRPQARAVELNDWRMQRVPTARNRREVRADFDDSQWSAAPGINDEWGPLAPGENAVYRTHLNVTAADLQSESMTADFGMIDDDGWVYVNGAPAGESHDWNAQPAFEIKNLLHEGDNVIAVAIKNKEGPGGLCRGARVQIQEHPAPVQWKRSAFNGLAQIILKATGPGTLSLTAHSDGLADGKTQIVTLAGPEENYLP